VYKLKDIVVGDQPFIFEALSDPDVIKHYGVSFSSLEETSEQMKFYKDLEENKTGKWWLIQHEDGEHVGACGFNYYQPKHQKIEIGYWLLPQYQRKGVMRLVLPQAIDMIKGFYEIHRIEAMVESDNASSIKLLKRLGFEHEGTMRECEFKNSEWISIDIYSLLL
jgi:ribosomal-protein-alanine N-acetyltransferase